MPGGVYAGPLEGPHLPVAQTGNVNDPVRSSGVVSASAAITTTPAALWGFHAYSAAGSGILYFRNGGGSGTILWQCNILTAGDALTVMLHKPLGFETDLYLSVTNMSAIVLFA
jgi:hypothetical protein